jgi:hypothetical protein
VATYCKKNEKSIAIILFLFVVSLSVFAQKTTPMIDSKGHIMNHNSIIGKMTPEGSFDPSGKSMTKIDSNGISWT